MNALDSARGYGSVAPSSARSPSVSLVVLPAELSDGELLSATRRLVGRSNQLLALLLGHLAEVEARGLHRTRACSSLYTYCIYELRFSEDEAFRRVAAARFVRRFPALLDAIASGELHLTGLLMLGPHLTAENLIEVLARSKHRTKKEIARLVRQLDPLPDVPARIEPLGPAPARVVPRTPTFSQFVESLSPIRELPVGERPRDWVDSNEHDSAAVDSNEHDSAAVDSNEHDSAAVDSNEHTPKEHTGECSNDVGLPEVVAAAPERGAPIFGTSLGAPKAAHELPAPARQTPPARLEPQRYRVQFTAGEEFVKLVEAAQALLSHSTERVPVDELQLLAMRALVDELERKKRAVSKRPAREHANANATREAKPKETRRRGRHIPAAVRRAVFERDQSRCAYVDSSGQRCRETHGLELHHLSAFAIGGEHTAENLALRCRAHNALAAEHDFGADFIKIIRESSRHESWRHQDER